MVPFDLLIRSHRVGTLDPTWVFERADRRIDGDSGGDTGRREVAVPLVPSLIAVVYEAGKRVVEMEDCWVAIGEPPVGGVLVDGEHDQFG
jgi:hypothetical protein